MHVLVIYNSFFVSKPTIFAYSSQISGNAKDDIHECESYKVELSLFIFLYILLLDFVISHLLRS